MQDAAIGVSLNLGQSDLLLELNHQCGRIVLLTDKDRHAFVGHVLGIILLVGVLLDGLGHHHSIFAVLANFLPELVLRGAEDSCVLGELLGYQNMSVINALGSGQLGGGGGNLLHNDSPSRY